MARLHTLEHCASRVDMGVSDYRVSACADAMPVSGDGGHRRPSPARVDNGCHAGIRRYGSLSSLDGRRIYRHADQRLLAVLRHSGQDLFEYLLSFEVAFLAAGGRQYRLHSKRCIQRWQTLNRLYCQSVRTNIELRHGLL